MMMKCSVVSEQDAEAIVKSLEHQEWEDNIFPQMCRNKQILMGDGCIEADQQMGILLNAIVDSPIFNTLTLPKQFGRPAFEKYEAGDEYRMHSDAAFVGNDPEVRTDFAATLFLSNPDDYAGGELVVRTVTGTTASLKEPAGTLVFYPAGFVHRIQPVVSGTRYTFTGWVESHIQDPQKRDIMVELSMACDELAQKPDMADLHTRFQSVRHGLYRQWMNIT